MSRKAAFSAFVKNADGSVYLSSTGKKLFIQAFNDKMGSKLAVNNKTITYYQLIEQEIRCYLDYLVDGKKYKPYKYY